jgi:hypothetical protein
MAAVVFLVIWCAAAAAVAWWIGHGAKGRPLTGLLLGLLLGWIGVLVTALLPPTAEKRVQRRLRDDAVAAEAARRRMLSGQPQPWPGAAPARDFAWPPEPAPLPDRDTGRFPQQQG